ncbi:MAG TPA: hypothetical protein VMF69_02575 [Gemmataceae bacterium]|nr:hypothetical protein [Gemmataceae bacterium]
MFHSAKPRWTARTIAASLFLSLLLHVLLFLVLWYWPARTPSPTLSIESTRITLDTCVLDSPSSTLLPERELPADLIGSNVETTLAPQLEQPPPKAASGEQRAARESKASFSPLATRHSPLFPVPATAASVVYVLDRSVSMGIDRKLDFARGELIASLRQLPPAVRFQVIDYNDFAESLIVDGRKDLLPAEPAIVDKAVSFLQSLEAAGASRHFAALCLAVDLHADVIFFLTDADDLTPEVISAITQRNRGSVIHTIELTRRRASQPDGPLARLARDNRGTYRRVMLGD